MLLISITLLMPEIGRDNGEFVFTTQGIVSVLLQIDMYHLYSWLSCLLFHSLVFLHVYSFAVPMIEPRTSCSRRPSVPPPSNFSRLLPIYLETRSC